MGTWQVAGCRGHGTLSITHRLCADTSHFLVWGHTQECWSPGTASLPLDGREQALGQKVPGVAYGRMPLTVNRLAVSGLHMGARDSPLPPPFSRRHKLGEVKFIVQSHTVVG